MMKKNLAILFFSLFISFLGMAKDVHLFPTSAIQAEQYYRARQEIRHGDRLFFTDGKTYEVDHLLGCGQTTCIYGLIGSPEKAIRIPKFYSLLKRTRTDTAHTKDFINAFLQGKKELNQYKIPSVDIYDGNENEYIIVEKVRSVTDLHHFLMNPFSFSDLDRSQMESDLIRFAKATAPFKNIGDFTSHQLHYIQGRGWVLLDWSDDHQVFNSKISNLKSEDVFDSIFYQNEEFLEMMTKVFSSPDEQWIRNLAKELKKVITQERRSIASRGTQSSQCLSFYKLLSKIQTK